MDAAALTAPLQPTTTDAFLGGRLAAVQPVAGHHRSGLEAILLAAAIEPSFAGTVVDLGAGAGVAGLAVAARCPRACVVLVDRDETALACARLSLSLPANRDFADRVTIVAADIAWPEAERAKAGLVRLSADAVVTNPPFNAVDRGTASPHPARADARVIGEGGLDRWLRTAASVLKPGGRLVVAYRADGLDALFAACRGRFGDLAVMPIHPDADAPASRVLVAAVKGSRAPSRLLPAFVLHAGRAGPATPRADALLRAGTGLRELVAGWPGSKEDAPWPAS